MTALNSTAPPRIGYVLAIFPGLTQTFVAREIEALKRRGFEVQVFALKRPDPGPAEQLSSTDTLRSCMYARPDRLFRHLSLNLWAMALHPWRYFSSLRIFARAWRELDPGTFARLLYHFVCGVGFSFEMRRRRIDQLHCHFAAGCSVALAAHLYSGIPFSFTAHASGDLFFNPVLLPVKVRYARMVAAVCEYSKRYLDAVTEYAYTRKLHRVYNGIDPEEPARLSPARDGRTVDAARSAAAFRLLSVGTLLGVKGYATLIDVCARLRQEGCPVQCTIIGSGPDREMLVRRIEGAGLVGVVELAGALPLGAVYDAMRKADVFVLLSEIGVNGYRDGFPTVILEAMTLGLPVVSTWLSGIPEMVEDQVTGLLVPERDPAAAAAALQRLFRDPALRARMGSAGAERVRRLFSLEQSADQLARLFSESPVTVR